MNTPTKTRRTVKRFATTALATEWLVENRFVWSRNRWIRADGSRAVVQPSSLIAPVVFHAGNVEVVIDSPV